MIGIIIQARLGSTRLPQKMVKDFHQGKLLIEVIIERLLQLELNKKSICLATTKKLEDKRLIEIAESYGINTYTGSENNVLSRFLKSADHYGYKNIVRICADNPFIDLESIQLIVKILKSNQFDYVSFLVNGTPSIKTHYGFWAEGVSYSALLKVRELASKNEDLEHVTKCIYENPNAFKIKWIDVPKRIVDRTRIRLTVDTEEDFNISKLIYNELASKESVITINDIIKFMDNHPRIEDLMYQQITKNQK